MASVLNTLDRVARLDNGEHEIRRMGGIPAILATMGPGRDTTEEMLRPAFRLLERFARDDAAVTEIRKNGGVEALVRQMEMHSKNDGLLRAAGRLLARVAEDDLEGTIKRLGEANLPTEVRQFLTALISNLAMRPDMIDKIIKNGGIKAILSGFAEFNDATKEAAGRAIGRLANNPENIAMLMRDGAVEAMSGECRGKRGAAELTPWGFVRRCHHQRRGQRDVARRGHGSPGQHGRLHGLLQSH